MASGVGEVDGGVTDQSRSSSAAKPIPLVASSSANGLLPDWAVQPRYDGYGTAAIPNTVLAHFGVEPRLPPLAPELLPPAMLEGVQTVVLLIIDALGYDQLARALDSGVCPNLAARLDSGRMRLSPLTTIFPSTTAAALTTYATGEPPIRHGMVGYTLWLEEAGAVVNMIRFAPVAGDVKVPTPEGFLTTPTVFERLQSAGVASVYINLKPLLGSGLSVMHSKGAIVEPAVSFADLCCTVRRMIEACAGERRFIQAYWDAVDGIAHLRGPRSAEHSAELASIDFTLGRELLDQLRRPDVLLLLAADHGQGETHLEQATWLNEEPELLRCLAHPPAGERRAVYLAVKPGKEASVEAWAAERLGERGALIDVVRALKAGLWGPSPFSDAALRRIGAYVLLPAPGWQLPYRWPGDDETPTLPIGAHGNLTREEALVPLLAARFG